MNAATAPALSESAAHAAAAAASGSYTTDAESANAYAATLRVLGYGMCASVTALSSSVASAVQLTVDNQPPASTLVTAMADSMATYFVVNKPEYIVRVTNNNPGFTVLTAAGVQPIVAVGDAHIWVPDASGEWRCYEVPNVLLMPACSAVLYSVRVMRDLFGFKHDFNSKQGAISMPGRSQSLPINDNGSAFAVPIAFSTVAQPLSRLTLSPSGRPAALLASIGSVFPADTVGVFPGLRGDKYKWFPDDPVSVVQGGPPSQLGGSMYKPPQGDINNNSPTPDFASSSPVAPSPQPRVDHPSSSPPLSSPSPSSIVTVQPATADDRIGAATTTQRLDFAPAVAGYPKGDSGNPSDPSSRAFARAHESYIKDLVEKYASHVSAGYTRKYDSPMEEGLRLSADDSPAAGSEAAEHMAPKKVVYMALVGAFLWLANMTRSEISHVTSQLARFISNPGIIHFNAAMRVLIYLDNTRSRPLRYAPNASLPLHVLVDSSWETKFSCSGAYFFFMGCPFHWFSKMQRSVTLSSAEAEFFGCMLALKDTLWIRDVLSDLNLLLPGPSMMWCDSKSAVAMAFDPVAFKNTKHILRAAEFLKHHTLCGSVTIEHAKGVIMIADILTKGQARPIFLQLIKLLDDYAKNSIIELMN